ncbi:MAG: MCP four helix bundle domain-containing protein, partial [Proteobacteria bacterium]|nr:MCP four helix bundle domain-containing protein [Pseudomonadota bacterium]
MNALNNYSIRAKVVAAFGVLLAVTVLLGVFAIQRLSLVNEGGQTVASNYLVASNALGVFSQRVMRYRQIQAVHILAATPEAKAHEEKTLGELVQQINGALAQYEPTVDAGEERRLADDMEAAWNAYAATNDKFVEMSRAGDAAGATAYYTGTLRDLSHDFQAKLQRVLDYQLTSGKAQVADMDATYGSAWNWIVIALSLAVLLCLGAGYTLVTSVSAPIRRMSDAMGRLARHDLSTEIDGIGRKDEVGEMAAAVQVFKTSMIETDRLKAEQEAQHRAAEERTRRLDDITKAFEASVGTVVQAVAAQATQMESSAQSMSGLTDILYQRDGDYCIAVVPSRWDNSGAKVCGAGGRYPSDEC